MTKRETCKWVVRNDLPKGMRCGYNLPQWLAEAVARAAWHAGDRFPDYVTEDRCADCPCHEPKKEKAERG